MATARKKPGRPKKVGQKPRQFSIRMEPALIEKARQIAVANGVSVSQAVSICVASYHLPEKIAAAAAALLAAREADGGAA